MDEAKDLSDNPVEMPADDESKNAISADLIRGHINTIILRTLYERDKYGYEIIEEIERKSHGQYSLKQPTLYSALKRLESQGYINAYWKTDEVSLGGRRKYYTLTDSGREITEKNQAEWEYSRTVIDNLISDRSFDFSQPAPVAVDFKILKKSTSRVPVVKNDNDDDDEYEDKIQEKLEPQQKQEQQPEKIIIMPEVEIKPETVTFTEQTVYYESPVIERQAPVEPIKEQASVPPVHEPIKEQTPTSPVHEQSFMNEEQRKIVHENYMRLISEPAVPPPPVEDVVPVAENIDTDKLIYNNKPETERDYKNLINNLFSRTVNRTHQQHVTNYEKAPVKNDTDSEDISVKADLDGLKVNSSDYIVSAHKKTYNRGATLLKSSLIVSIVLLFEFILCILFKDDLGVNIAYPFVIFALALAQLLIFGVLYYTDRKNTRKPSSTIYLTACIIVTIILLVIVFIVSLLLNIDFTSAGDIFAKIIVPWLVVLNIPLFAGCFYAFSKLD